MKPVDIILLSTADWDNPFWTNKQHVAVQLADRGHRVFISIPLVCVDPVLVPRIWDVWLVG
ncbi:hypothetical protein N752_30185 [Desulforamulus aquiferis]|nr:hypothetical protein [Desulforamulus aquiferis]RYD01267.1 hypothetical protein N752_30185 [Desulforamulus aquiferis]